MAGRYAVHGHWAAIPILDYEGMLKQPKTRKKPLQVIVVLPAVHGILDHALPCVCIYLSLFLSLHVNKAM